jgi:sporulation protein YlmC with PRC-barrel domain
VSTAPTAVKISDILGKPVVDAGSGKKLGRAWDVRIRRENKQTSGHGSERWVVTALVVSSRGALERFGFMHLQRFHPAGEWRSKRDAIAWDRVVRIGPEAIEVRSE